jgi:putative redox protein
MRSERVEFEGSHGVLLAGKLERPEGPARGYAVFAHCFTCGKDVLAASRISRALAGDGFAVLRFDFTGLGGSDGEFANTNFSSNVADLVAAASYLREQHRAPSLLVGHSLGGAAVIAAAGQIPEVRAVATIAAPSDTDHLLHLLSAKAPDIEETGQATVCLADREFTITKQFLDDVAAQPQEQRVKELDAALLVMHSPLDRVVGIENAGDIFRNARHPKSFVSLDEADHLLTRREDAEYAAGILAAWAERYVDQPDAAQTGPAASTGKPDEAVGTVVVAEDGTSRYAHRVTVGRHAFTADEPVPVGEDTGPSPYDLVLAGLGACTSMTLRMYAERKEWPLEHVSVSLTHERVHADDCETCETEEGHLDRITRGIRIEGDLDEEQRERLRAIADRCPVHRTLQGEVVVETELE